MKADTALRIANELPKQGRDKAAIAMLREATRLYRDAKGPEHSQTKAAQLLLTKALQKRQ